MIEEILERARAVLDDARYRTLAEDLEAAADLPEAARLTSVRVALSKYPETREMVSRLASDERTGVLRGEWLSREDWRSLAGDPDVDS